MLVNENDVPKLSLINQLKMQHSNFCIQRDQVNINLQQLTGAIYACETMIKKYEDENCRKGDSQEQLGVEKHVETHDQEQEQTAQE